jgi:hypothetical protein
MSDIMFYSWFYDMDIEFTTFSTYLSQLDSNHSFTMMSIFACLLADDENNQLFFATCIIQTVISAMCSIPWWKLDVISAMCSIPWWKLDVISAMCSIPWWKLDVISAMCSISWWKLDVISAMCSIPWWKLVIARHRQQK